MPDRSPSVSARRFRTRRLLAALALLPLLGCARTPPPPPVSLDTLAPDYVKLVLGIGEHDPAYVDAYYGPEEWRAQVKAEALDLKNLAWHTSDLIKAVGRLPETAGGAPGSDAELTRLRHDYLLQQARSAASRIALLQGAKMSFDEESQALYDAVAPKHEVAYFDERVAKVEALMDSLPAAAGGAGRKASLRDRIEAFRDRLTIPPEKVAAVFDRAIAECRERTKRRIELPADESFTVEQVTDKPWSAYNWYQGHHKSLIQVNVSLPIRIDRAVDLACHEGYPGHHVYNLLLEQKLVEERGWPEYQVYALFSPQSLIAEGSANFGIRMAFPGEERIAFERDVLYPLAGLDPALAEPYARLRELLEGLSYAGNEAARDYLDGRIDAAAAAAFLEKYEFSSPERAKQRISFFDTYRSYVINYNLGQDLVRDYVDARGGTSDEAKRWEVFTDLISSPRLPSGLVVEPPPPPPAPEAPAAE
ncbi:MAG: hypothetical protein AB7G12_06060 [Thermoanaerobaculia bacterium]